MTDRRTEKVAVDGTWVEVPFTNLVPGDIFRAFEPDGTVVRDPSGYVQWKVVSVHDENALTVTGVD